LQISNVKNNNDICISFSFPFLLKGEPGGSEPETHLLEMKQTEKSFKPKERFNLNLKKLK